MNSVFRKKLAPDLLGKIVLARFLEIPLRSYDQLVRRLDRETLPLQIAGKVSADALEETRLAVDVLSEEKTLGEIGWDGDTPELFYHSPSFVREYWLGEEVSEQGPPEESHDEELRKTLQRLRLVNTRNRLTHALVRALLSFQTAYLRTGDPTLLLPLTQKQISEELTTGGLYSGVADPSRISRLVKNVKIREGERGRIIALSELAPGTREVGCYFVARVIKNEKSLMKEDRIADPLTDEEISERVRAEFGVRMSKRTVAYVRRELGIPAGRERRSTGLYHEETAGFSPPLPLSLPILREIVPYEPGVYEIRSFLPGTPEGIVYIGSSGNLRRRLAHHLTGSGNNLRLREKVSGGARFRYQVFKEGWRSAERTFYRAFCSTFGAPPECNRMSP
ncbi:MAG: RNA polymerase factor sigma-54 [Leptospirales bacterium]